jgi:hypothetical protein
MFGFVCNVVCAAACCYVGFPVLAACAVVGGVFWLIPTGNDD